MTNLRRHWLPLSLLALLSCEAGGPDVTITLSGDTAIPIDVVSYYVLLQNVGTPVLDSNRDGDPDLLTLPSDCNPRTNVLCGYEFEPGTFSIGEGRGLPMTYSYDVYVLFRDIRGNVRSSGKTAEPFRNDGENQTITVPIQDGNILEEGT